MICFGLLYVFGVLIVFDYWCLVVCGLWLCVDAICVVGWSFAFGVALGFVGLLLVLVGGYLLACIRLWVCCRWVIGVWWICGCFGVGLVICCLC